MNVKIKKLEGGWIPIYQTPLSAGFDIPISTDKVIPTGQCVRVPTGLVIESPPGYCLMIAARSSLASKKGLMLANGIGIIDRDYAGDNDEIQLLLYNFTDQDVLVRKGERLAQGVFIHYAAVDFNIVDSIAQINRDGFGSTGGYSD